LAGLSDLLDGTMARLSNTAGPWGAFLDSTLDRVVDGAIYGSLIFYYVNADVINKKLVVALLIGLISAQITSYTRARWESLGVRGKVGLVERSERMIVLCTGLILTGLGFDVLATLIYFLAVASTITVIQRILFARKSLKPQSAQ
jgi:phosphatidylglycerophosphate synthase